MAADEHLGCRTATGLWRSVRSRHRLRGPTRACAPMTGNDCSSNTLTSTMYSTTSTGSSTAPAIRATGYSLATPSTSTVRQAEPQARPERRHRRARQLREDRRDDRRAQHALVRRGCECAPDARQRGGIDAQDAGQSVVPTADAPGTRPIRDSAGRAAIVFVSAADAEPARGDLVPAVLAGSERHARRS